MHVGGVLDETDIKGGAGEEAGGEDGQGFGEGEGIELVILSTA
jgi:hypothetical protein